MEKEVLMTVMKDSISEVLETMFFLPLEYSDAPDPEGLWGLEKDRIVASRLNFSGPFSGYFVFLIPRDLALSITAGFVGRHEEHVSQDQIAGNVKEIINMIAGSTFGNYDDMLV